MLTSSVNYWLRMGKTCCPHLVVSSHMHAIIELLDDAEEIVSYHVSFE